MGKPQLLLLEDSQDSLDGMIRVVNRLGWQAICARSLEQAERICAKGNLRIDAALVDLMLPRRDHDLDQLNKLLKRREIQSLKFIDKGTSPQEKAEANAQLEAIDKNIMALIADEGGTEFINSKCGKELFSNKEIAVAIFTAHGANLQKKATLEKLKDSVSKALGRPPSVWFAKPVDPLELEDWLKEIGKSRRVDC